MRKKTSIRGVSAAAVAGLSTLAVLAGLVVGENSARAEPVLQLYIEGAEYDKDTETWTLEVPVNSSFRLWAVGFVANSPGGYMIKDVRLAAAYPSEYAGLEIAFSPTLAFGDGKVPESKMQLDTMFPVAPAQNGIGSKSASGRTFVRTYVEGSIDDLYSDDLSALGEVLNGGVPVLGTADVPTEDSRPLPSHGQYGPGVVWQEYSLGDFTDFGVVDPYTVDASIGDLIDGFDPAEFDKPGQINAYDVTVTGAMDIGATVSFDLYNTVLSKNQAKFAPFSHNASGETFIPEPSSIVVWSLLAAIGIAVGWRRRRRAA